jgi:hypothetical protein
MPSDPISSNVFTIHHHPSSIIDGIRGAMALSGSMFNRKPRIELL